VLFLDEDNRTNPVPHLYTEWSDKPCSEQWLRTLRELLLGLINLAQAYPVRGRQAQVDWAKLEDRSSFLLGFSRTSSAPTSTSAVPQLQSGARARRIGLGIMGLADDVPTGHPLRQPESLEFAGQVMELCAIACARASSWPARPFPGD
jgi:ribonucleotide reductase alpha subunit